MKKKLIIILIGALLIIGLGIYFIVIKSHVKINTSKDITLTIKEDTLTNEKITLILTNNSDKNVNPKIIDRMIKVMESAPVARKMLNIPEDHYIR